MSISYQKTKKAAPAPKGDGFHVVQKVIGSDTYLVLADSASHVEDEYNSLYYTSANSSNVVLAPPYEPATLAGLVMHNNILNQCVEAMEVNIDGTGHTFEPKDDETKLDVAEQKRLTEFFNEPYPGQSFIQIRRKLRRDMESVGYAALEVLENLQGDIVGLRNMDTYLLRFVKLDEPVMVEKTFTRDGKDVTIKMMDRERRFMQRLGNKFFYYREYGSTRNVNKFNGQWEEDGTVIKPEDRGTKLIIFGINPDIRTPYFVPRWINQLPSVIGSRKAEEQNLEFFDAGGLPPAIIFIQGGTLAGSAAEQLKTYLSGKNKNKNRAVVVEAQSASGSLESAGQVKVTVERFGAAQVNDSMYEKYDKNAEEHVRVGFRLPALFLGRTDNYNYATAVVAYMVAEEQVFQPERGEFDEVINKTILRALGAKTARFKSKGITLKNVDAQLKALEMVKDVSEGKGLIDEVNKVVGLSLEYKEPEDPADLAARTAGAVHEATPPHDIQLDPNKTAALSLATANGKKLPDSGTKTPAKTPKKASDLIDLAMSYGQMRGILATPFDMSEAAKQEVVERVTELGDDDRTAFNSIVASYTFGGADADLLSLVDSAHDH